MALVLPLSNSRTHGTAHGPWGLILGYSLFVLSHLSSSFLARKAWSKLNTSACLLDRTSGVVIKATPTWIQEGLPLEGQRLSTLDLTFETHLKALKPLEDGRVPTSLDITIKGKPYKMEALEEEALGIILVQPKH